MTAFVAIGRFFVDACILVVLTAIAIFVYSLYNEDPRVVNTIYCEANTKTDLGFDYCMDAYN